MLVELPLALLHLLPQNLLLLEHLLEIVLHSSVEDLDLLALLDRLLQLLVLVHLLVLLHLQLVLVLEFRE